MVCVAVYDPIAASASLFSESLSSSQGARVSGRGGTESETG